MIRLLREIRDLLREIRDLLAQAERRARRDGTEVVVKLDGREIKASLDGLRRRNGGAE